MAKVRLKQNLIFGGAFYAVDTVLDEEVLPLDRRGPEFVIKPPGPDPEAQVEEIPAGEEGEFEEELPPPDSPPPKKR